MRIYESLRSTQSGIPLKVAKQRKTKEKEKTTAHLKLTDEEVIDIRTKYQKQNITKEEIHKHY